MRGSSIVVLLVGVLLITLFFLFMAPQHISPNDTVVDAFTKGVAFATSLIPVLTPIVIVLVLVAGAVGHE